jgi:hypothetical protein
MILPALFLRAIVAAFTRSTQPRFTARHTACEPVASPGLGPLHAEDRRPAPRPAKV